MNINSEAASRWWIPILLAMGFFAAVSSLRSNDPGAIDGAVRALQVYQVSSAPLRGNNHLLYNWHLFVFSRVLRSIGIEASSPYAFFSQMTYLNALASALALAIFAILIHKLTKDRAISFLVTVLFGATSAFWSNAANPNEPMPGFLFAMLAGWAAVRAIETNEGVYPALCAFLLAYAMATYQSMFSIMPALAIAMCAVIYRRYGRRSALTCALIFAVSLLVSVSVIYSTAYRLGFGLSTPHQLLQRFFTLDGRGHSGVWGHVDPIKLLSLWPASLSAIFCLPYPGMRALFSYQKSLLPLWGFAIAPGLALIFPALLSLRKLATWSFEERAILGLLALVPLFSVTCLLYWDVSYLKLWLEPLAGAGLCYGYLLYQAKRREGSQVLLWAGIGTALVIAWNAHFVYFPMHRGQIERDQFLLRANTIVQEPAVIFTEWDEIGPVFTGFYPGSNREFVSILDLDHKLASKEVDSIYRRIKEKGGHVYFMGVLNKNRRDWDMFLGNKWRLAYEIFEPYRKKARSALHARVATSVFDLYEID